MNRLLLGLFLLGILVILAYSFFYAKNMGRIEAYLDSRYTPADFGCSIKPQEVKEGLAFFKTKKILICGLIRNADNVVSILRKNVEKIGSFFQEYHALVVENDSKDDTRGLLLAWAKQTSHLTVLGCGENVGECKLNLPATVNHSRKANLIRKMVMLRNIYLDYIADHPDRFSTYDFVVVWDMDIRGTFYEDGLGHAGYLFKTRGEINSLCANGIQITNSGFQIKRTYYDPFAHEDLTREDLRKVENFWMPLQEACSANALPKVVRSCFNGFTIYRKAALTDKRYIFELADENEPEGKGRCEHITLNEQISGSYLDPMLVFAVLRNG